MRGACLVTKLGSLMRAAFAVAGPGVWADARPEHLSVVSLDDPTFVQRRLPLKRGATAADKTASKASVQALGMHGVVATSTVTTAAHPWSPSSGSANS